MTGREKIIVAMMCITIAYGAYELLSSGSLKEKSQETATNSNEEIQNIVAEISKQLSINGADTNREVTAKLIASAWPKDPFIHSTVPLKNKKESLVEKQQSIPEVQSSPKMIYSGFLEVGQIKLAIINGMEYSEGEAIETTGYYVRSISARHAIVGQLNGAQTIRLPLQEISTDPANP